MTREGAAGGGVAIGSAVLENWDKAVPAKSIILSQWSLARAFSHLYESVGDEWNCINISPKKYNLKGLSHKRLNPRLGHIQDLKLFEI